MVSIAGKCLDNPDGCSIDEIKSLSASHLSIRQGHDDPVFKAGRTFVEERYVVEDYDDSDESWEDHAVVECGECTNLAAKDCDYGFAGVAAVAARATADGNLRLQFENGDEMHEQENHNRRSLER